MAKEPIHRFELEGKRFAVDPETCFCFECDAISWDVLGYYPDTSVNRIYHQLGRKHPLKDLAEVVSELEWLRATKAILPEPKREDLLKPFAVERGLRRLTIRLPREAGAPPAKRGWFGPSAASKTASPSALELGDAAIGLLLARSGAQPLLVAELLESGHVHDPQLIADLCARAFKSARLAGKQLVATVRITDVPIVEPPRSLEGHSVTLAFQFREASSIPDCLREFEKQLPARIDRLAAALEPKGGDGAGRIIVRPNHPQFGDVAADLEKAGLKVIELDIEGSYVAHPELVPSRMAEGLAKSAEYYARRLLEQQYFRLEPLATLFRRIYEGTPMPRTDPSGTNDLAVDETGAIYPSWLFLGMEQFRLGSVADGAMDEERLGAFDDVGAVTTAVCRRCWIRNLCGGGCAAVHQALAGSYRTPLEAWCEAQRTWMASAIAAFNRLSSQGVNFTRIYGVLGASTKPSFFSLLRAAFRASIGVRPLEEADAAMLVQWETWNLASYFTLSEGGVLVATKYDREMDALHPQGPDQEMIVVRKDRAPIGLLRLRPDHFRGAAKAWIYLRNDADYAAADIRKGFRTLLQDISSQQDVRRLTASAAENEKPLRQFLEAVGFTPEGSLREALFLHGSYHDVHVYGLTLSSS